MSDDGFGGGDAEWKQQISQLSIARTQLNDALDILADDHARYTLYGLLSEDGKVFGYDEVSEFLLEHYPDTDDLEEHKILLHHKTLPRMAEKGIVDFDPRSETIRYRGGEEIATMVTCLAEIEEGLS